MQYLDGHWGHLVIDIHSTISEVHNAKKQGGEVRPYQMPELSPDTFRSKRY